MEQTGKVYAKLDFLTGASEVYQSNVKALFIRRHGMPLEYCAQHENVKVLQKEAVKYARRIGDTVRYELRTGTGVLVGCGTIYAIDEEDYNVGH